MRPTGGVASGDGDEVSLLWLIWHEDARAGRDRLDIARVASPGGDGFSVTSMVEDAGLVWDVRSEADFDGGEVLMRVCGVQGDAAGLEVWVEGSSDASLSVARASGGSAGAGTGGTGVGLTGAGAAVVGGGLVRVDVTDLARDEDGCMLLPALVTSSGPVAASIRNDIDIPQSVTLSAPYPNPFNPSTRVTFELASPAQVRLRIVDVLGRPVQIIADGWHESGRHNYIFDAGELAAGMYLIVLESSYGTHTRSATLIK